MKYQCLQPTTENKSQNKYERFKSDRNDKNESYSLWITQNDKYIAGQLYCETNNLCRKCGSPDPL